MNVRDLMADPQGWKRVSTLFDELFELPPDRRSQWLEDLRQREPAVAAHLERLLDAHERVDQEQFLELSQVDGPAPRPVTPDTLAGSVFGAYSLVRPLGQGGMGWVWLANRNDGRFEGQVAIKLLHPGLIRAADVERFRREGNVLARLSHPNIARLLDAGVANGQPYLVLEYVSGRRIDEACELAQLDLPARVRLGIEALEAVSHAHARLVLHRDIKPSNVLVDDDGHVKLIDFGVARLVEAEDGSATSIDVTREFGQAFTPRFGAPEQWNGGPVGTTTDVYSMGLLLYVLLAGANPRDGLPGNADPATVFPLASQVALQRGNARQAKTLRGDLDNVLAKAVKADPAERYVTAGALADDLRRFLRGDPVTARPDSVGYRLRRFVGRHKLGVGGGIAALVAIGMLSAAAMWQGAEARTQRTVAVARGAAAYAIAQASTRIDRALLLGVEAVRMHQAPETTVGLYSALDAARHLVGFRRELGADTRFVVSPDRRHAAAIDVAGHVRHWTLPGWQLLAERDTGVRNALGLLFAGKNDRLLVAGLERAQVLDASTLVPVSPDIVPKDAGEDALFDISGDGRLIATSVYQRGRRVTLHDASTGAPTSTIDAQQCGTIFITFFLPGRDEIALGCHNGLFVHDLRSGAQVRARPGGITNALNADPRGRHLVVAGWDDQVIVVDPQTLVPVMPTLPIPGGRAYSSAFSANGDVVAIGTDTGWVTVWDIKGQREIARFGGLDQGVLALDWLEDDFTIGPDKAIVGRARLLAGTLDGVTEWDVAQTSSLGEASRPSLPPAQDLALAHDVARDVAYVGRQHPDHGVSIDAISVVDGATVRTLPVEATLARPLAVSPDGQRLVIGTATTSATGTLDLAVRVIDTSTGRLVTTLEIPEGFFPRVHDQPTNRPPMAPFVSIRFSPDGTRLAAWRVRRLTVWDVSTGKVSGSAPAALSSTWAWSPDSRFVVFIFNGVFTMHDRDTAQPAGTADYTRTFSIKHAFPSSVLGGIVFTSEGGEVAVFDTTRKAVVGEPFRAGGSQLQTSAISGDGRYLAATSSDGAVRVWDVSTRVPIAPPLKGHQAGRGFPYVWFSSGGRLSTLVQGQRIEWTLDASSAAEAACQRVGRALTEWEWRQFVGNVTYAPACRP